MFNHPYGIKLIMMKKITLLLTGSLICGSVCSQMGAMNVFVANGGVFETSLPYADYVTIGYYDVYNESYTLFDTIYTQSVQDIYLDWDGIGEAHLLVAAQDSIIKYDALINLGERVAVTSFPNIKFVKQFEEIVVAGKWFGSGNAVQIYNDTLNLIDSITDSEIPYTVYDAVAWLQDTLYVSFNIPGTVDLCPPFGCYQDSIGQIGVFDLIGGSYIRTIDLGEAGAGARHVSIDNGNIIISCVESNNVLNYNINSASIDTLATGITSSYGFDRPYDWGYPAALTGVFNGIIDSYNVNNDNFPYFSSNANANTARREVQTDMLFYTQTDFSTYGKLFWTNGVTTDSIDVGISPDAIAIQYHLAWSVDESVADIAKIYPNPSNGFVNIEGEKLKSYSIYDLAGHLVQNGSLLNGSNTIDVDLHSGVYFINIQSYNRYVTKKLIIQ